MKRIISLSLAVLMLLGTLTGVLMSMAYAQEGGGTTQNEDGNDDEQIGGDSNVLSSSGIYIESYYLQNRMLTLVLVDTNVKVSDASPDSFGEFYASLLTSNFYPSSTKNPQGSPSITDQGIVLLKENAEGDAAQEEKNLRFKVTLPNVLWDRKGSEVYFRMYYTYDGVEYGGYEVRATLSQFVPPTPDDGGTSTPEPDPTVPDPATPYILVQNYNYGGSDVTAGADFALGVTFYNTSANIALENIIMKVEPTSGLSITGASNTYYVPSLAAKGAMTKSIPLRCLPSAEPGNESVHITFSYEYVTNDTRQTKSSEETISIPISQVERFEVELSEVPTMLYPGESTNVVLNYVNKGRAQIYNLTAKIEGNIDNPNQLQNLGNIPAGESGTAKFSLSSMEAGGTVSCVVTVTYENEKGDVSTITKDLNCQVYDNSGEIIDPGMDPGFDPGIVEPMEEPGMRWWQWALFGTGSLAVGGVSGTWMFLKTKLKREEADDEDI